MDREFEFLLSNLLKTDNSIFPLVLRLGLSGLRAQLDDALKQISEDPGKDVCQELINKLDRLLESYPVDAVSEKNITVSSFSPKDQESIFPRSENFSTNLSDFFEPAPELSLKQIGEELSHRLSDYIGSQYEFKSTSDVDLWHEIQCLLLRIPVQEADTWREWIVQQVMKIGAYENKRSMHQIPFARKENLYYGLKGGIVAPGLRLSKRVDSDGQLGFLDCVVNLYLKLIDKLDPSNFYHALEAIDLFDIKSLELKEEKFKYKTFLTQRLQDLQQKDTGDPIEALNAAISLDEAINCLIHIPISDSRSWWYKLQQEARDQLEYWVDKVRDTGCEVEIRYLSGAIADIFKEGLSKNDVRKNIGGVPGEVTVCLRVYSKINGVELPGRTIWCPSSP